MDFDSQMFDIPDEHVEIQHVRVINFQEKIRTNQEKLHKLNHDLDKIILKNELNFDKEKSIIQHRRLLKNLETFIEEFNKQKHHSAFELDTLTIICRKLNENVIIQKIVQLELEQKLNPEETSNMNVKDYNEEDKDQEISQQELNSNLSGKQSTEQIPEDLQNIYSLIEEAKKYDEEQVIDKAEFVRSQIDIIVQKYETDPKYSEYIFTFQKQFDQILDSISRRYDFCVKNVAALNDQEGWKVERCENGITIKFKQPKDQPTVSLQMETIMNVPIKKMIALANESDHMSKYVPFVEYAKTVNQFTKARKMCYSKVSLPVISDRDLYFYGEGFDRLEENGTITMICKTIHDDKNFQDFLEVDIPAAKGMVRLDFNYYVYQIQPLGENKCRIRAVTNVNPHVEFIPQSIMNWIGRKFAYHLFEKMINKASTEKNFKPWQDSIDKNPIFYEWIQIKVDKYFQSETYQKHMIDFQKQQEKIKQ